MKHKYLIIVVIVGLMVSYIINPQQIEICNTPDCLIDLEMSK